MSLLRMVSMFYLALICMACAEQRPADPAAAEVAEMTRKVIEGTKRTPAAAGLFLSDTALIPAWQEAGATLFITGTDQGFLSSAARRARPDFGNA